MKVSGVSGSATARGVRAVAALLFLLLAATACGLNVPTDPEGTLDAVRGGTLRVGVSAQGDFIEVSGAAGPGGAVAGEQVSGTEADLVRGFADELNAGIAFYAFGEEALVRRLEAGEIDVAVGGFTNSTPWTSRVGSTRPYTETLLDDGRKHKIVMLVPMGENAFVSELERYLDATTGEQAGGAR